MRSGRCCVSFPTYTLRNRLLCSLGYSSYDDYLESELWAEIKDAVLDRDRWRCRVCDAQATAVHHTDYNRETLLGDSFDGLVSICHGCHAKIELDRNGNKRPLFKAMMVYFRLVGCKRIPYKTAFSKSNLPTHQS